MNQLSLLGEKRFRGLFWTQFLGAFNDNLFKMVLGMLVTFRGLRVADLTAMELVPLANGIFVLPFFLFSASAGQISDKYPKHIVMRWVKGFEIAIMMLAALGFVLESLVFLLGVLFLMGFQSTLFGPAKYSVLPELLDEDELVAGNALVETGTFLAILLGTILGGVLTKAGDLHLISGILVCLALWGFLSSWFIPATPAAQQDLVVNFNPAPPTLSIIGHIRQNLPVYRSILAISWFWFLGAAILSLLMVYTQKVLGGAEVLTTFFLAIFCAGIALGSLACERLSGRQLELGLVPLGSIGLSVAFFDLFWVGDPGWSAQDGIEMMEYFSQPQSLRIALDFLVLAFSGGVFTVPLYTMVQERTEPAVRSRVIAGLNIINALFMVASQGLLLFCAQREVSITDTFLVLGLMNVVVAIYIYSLVPEFTLRFMAWVLASQIYKIKVSGVEHLPRKGAAVLVCNHVSFVDWLIIASVFKRPARFIMHHSYFKKPWTKWLFRAAKVIPIAPKHEDAATLEEAYDTIAKEIEEGEVVCIFPEGKLTRDGEMNTFRQGIEKIIERSPVPVIPMALGGMWGSYFSHSSDKGFLGRLFAKIRLDIGAPIMPGEATASVLESKVKEMLTEGAKVAKA
jgi:1-acyl-sn-glycerol-3-phosphate acyltransferase